MDTEQDASVYTTIGGEPFVTWPIPSPTSRLGINLRFYSIDDDDSIGARYRIDIGVSHERSLEAMYFDFGLSKSVTPPQFEEAIREMFQSRLAFVNAYGIATLLYVSMTTDPKEMGRMSRRERRLLRSQQRRFPYMVYPKYQQFPSDLPTLIGHMIRTTIAKFFHI